MNKLIKYLKHKLGFCKKHSLGYKCYGSKDYKECGE